MIIHKKFTLEEVLEGFLFSVLMREMPEEVDCQMSAEFDEDGNVDVYIDDSEEKPLPN